MQSLVRAIDAISVHNIRRPQPHNTNPQKIKRKGKTVEDKKRTSSFEIKVSNSIIVFKTGRDSVELATAAGAHHWDGCCRAPHPTAAHPRCWSGAHHAASTKRYL